MRHKNLNIELKKRKGKNLKSTNKVIFYSFKDSVVEKKDEAIEKGTSVAKTFMSNKGSLFCILLIIIAMIAIYMLYRKAYQ